MNGAPIKQGATLEAREPFAFKSAAGRMIRVKQGARFWVTSAEYIQRRDGCVMIDRLGRGCISHGHAFAPADVARLFTVQGN